MKKRIIALIIALTVFTGSAAAAMLGDIDNDGSITVSDALSALKMAVGTKTADPVADVDGDGSVTVTDALQLLRCSLGFITEQGLSGDYDFAIPFTQRAKDAGLTKEMVDRGIVSKGDPARIVNVMRKAKAGEDITVGFIGGSVTYGGAATTEYTRWARVVENWWKTTFPESKITYVNAGLSGTPSLFGVHRVEEDLLSKEPDFVVIEFGVNDELQAWQKEAYASLVRRILTDDCDPAVMLFYVMNNGGTNAQADQQPIGEFYDLPMVSYRDAIWPEVEKGTFKWEKICADWVHPTDAGHALCGELINSLLQGIYDSLDKLSSEIKPVRADVPLPYSYEHTEWLRPANTTPLSLGSFKPMYADSKYGWGAKGSDSDPLIIRFYGKRLVLPTISGESDTIVASVSVDGKTPVILDNDTLLISAGVFAYYMVYDAASPAWHTVEITLLNGTLTTPGLFVSW